MSVGDVGQWWLVAWFGSFTDPLFFLLFPRSSLLLETPAARGNNARNGREMKDVLFSFFFFSLSRGPFLGCASALALVLQGSGIIALGCFSSSALF